MECSVGIGQETELEDNQAKVLHSNKVIWSICEDDVLYLARERGMHLTRQELDHASKCIERGLHAVCNWFMLVDLALNEIQSDNMRK